MWGFRMIEDVVGVGVGVGFVGGMFDGGMLQVRPRSGTVRSVLSLGRYTWRELACVYPVSPRVDVCLPFRQSSCVWEMTSYTNHHQSN